MIACKVQLLHVIQDKIQHKIQSETKSSETKFNPRQNPGRGNFFLFEKYFAGKKKLSLNFSRTEFCLGHYLGFPEHFF